MISRDKRYTINEAIRYLEGVKAIRVRQLRADIQPQLSSWMTYLTKQGKSQAVLSRKNLGREFEKKPKSFPLFIRAIKRELDGNPWKFLGKVALVSFMVGLLVGHCRKRKSPGDRK